MNNRHIWIWFFTLGFSFNTLRAQPVIVQEPESRTALEGRRVEFNVEAVGSTPLSYQWQFNGSDIAHADGDKLHFTATLSRAGNYSVVVRDGAGGSSRATAQLAVQKRPVILQQPKHQVVGEFQTAVFEVRMNDSGPYTSVNWWHHSPEEPHHAIPTTAVATAQQFRMEIPNCTDNGTYNGLYWIVVTNNVGWAISRRASLTVVGPPRLTSEPQDRAVRLGHTASFSVSVAPDAAGHKTEQWYFNNNPIPGATKRGLHLHRVQPEQQGFYRCVVTSIGGSTASYDAVLTVY